MDSIKSKLKHRIHVLFVSILIGANIATIMLMWASCLTTELSPIIHPRLSQAGLLFPVFLAINISFILVWFFVSWKWLLLPIIGIIGCWNYVRDYCPLNLGRAKEDGIIILSYNVANFFTDESNDMDGQRTMEYILESNADIICLQECPKGGNIFQKLKERMEANGYKTKFAHGLRIFSKWPFIGKAIHEESKDTGNGSLAWMINIDGDTTLIINSHLQSNGISEEEKDVYENAIERYDQEQMKATGKLLLSRLSKAASKRANQTDTLCSIIKQYERHSIIATGDMNDTPISYTFQAISGYLNSAFTESGNGLGISFIRKGFPVRIDHIFVSKNLKTSSTYIDSKIESSDHYPILTRVYKSAK